MTETKFGKAFKEYRDVNITAINWIIGLIIGEIGLVLGLNYVNVLWIIFLLLLFASLAVILATLIMYVLVSQSSIELFSAGLALENPQMSEEEYHEKYFEKHGKSLILLTNLVVDFDLYRWLFIFFLLETVCLFANIIIHLIYFIE